ncbi:HNH endonuclease [Haloprofundus salilacus]|uniref:HNH endonuclease n=1 Tax=Haloprofundus salilacus TaxID=2876190 RepID=UPI001CCE1BB7|nr:helix-turn-helix domain-containing protein [Haloprofundus salilacus]
MSAVAETSPPVERETLQEKIERSEKPYQNREILEILYLEEEMSQQEIANYLGCSQSSVSNWLARHDIDTRDRSEAAKKNHVGLSTRGDTGYVRCYSNDPDGSHEVYLHQLQVIHDGEDPHKVFSSGEYQVHHKNGIPFDNRSENLELMSASDHTKHHHEQRKSTH